MNTLKQSELIALLGLPSTAPQMVSFFEQYDLGKLPKTITPNQGTKSVVSKSLNISFWFKYDIKNDKHQPPVSPKNDNYKFVAYLSSIMFTHTEHSDKRTDPKPIGFWDVLLPPNALQNDVQTLMGNPVDRTALESTYEMALNTDQVLTVKYSDGGKGKLLYSSWVAVKQQSEIIGRNFFNRDHDFESFPFLRRAHTVIIKWLFDNRLLHIDKQVYEIPLKPEEGAILDFVDTYLNNHIWKNQLVDAPLLSSFLYTITTNRLLTAPDGTPISFYIRSLLLETLDQTAAFERLYEDHFDAVDQFLNHIIFDAPLYQGAVSLLDEKFKLFKTWRSTL